MNQQYATGTAQAEVRPWPPLSMTGTTSDRLVLPKFGEWPYFPAPTWLRNGREAGAWLVGIIHCIPEKCAHVWVQDEFVAGATHAMVEGGLVVKSYSYDGEQGGTTLEVRSAHHEFVEPPGA